MKLLGISLLLFSGAAYAVLLRKRLDLSLAIARGLCELLRNIRECVESFSLSAPLILRRCPPELFRSCGYDSDLAPDDLSELAARCDIPDVECRRIFEEFCSDFGKYYRDDQVKRCEHCLGLMESRASQICAELPAKKKTGTAFSIMAVLILAIILA